MSEYWKSLPRKFCDMCKCWFADNKASIEFHERGKKHKENAQKRIQQIQKKGIKDFKKQQELEDDMQKIEEAAMAAYQKDLQNKVVDCPYTEFPIAITKKTAVVPKATAQKPNTPKQKSAKQTKQKFKKNKFGAPSGKKWFEAMTKEGRSYYYHCDTNESRWDPPEDGFVSLDEQNPHHASASITNEHSTEDREGIEKVPIASVIGPQQKVDPYGKWTAVVEEKYEEIDLQLPELPNDTTEVSIPVPSEEPKVKFKEKVIGQLTDVDSSEEVTFKKRKFGAQGKRNVRQRLDDD